jgi:hypothetical protein
MYVHMLLVVLILVPFIGHYFSDPCMALSLHVCVAAVIQGKTVQYFVAGGKKVILFVNCVVHYPVKTFSQQEPWHH